MVYEWLCLVSAHHANISFPTGHVRLLYTSCSSGSVDRERVMLAIDWVLWMGIRREGGGGGRGR